MLAKTLTSLALLAAFALPAAAQDEFSLSYNDSAFTSSESVSGDWGSNSVDRSGRYESMSFEIYRAAPISAPLESLSVDVRVDGVGVVTYSAANLAPTYSDSGAWGWMDYYEVTLPDGSLLTIWTWDADWGAGTQISIQHEASSTTENGTSVDSYGNPSSYSDTYGNGTFWGARNQIEVEVRLTDDGVNGGGVATSDPVVSETYGPYAASEDDGNGNTWTYSSSESVFTCEGWGNMVP
jgi:hypothetical protein